MIHIRLTDECNFNCFFCHIPQLKPKKLSFIDILKLVMLVDHSSPQIFSISGGEPSSVPYLLMLIKYIKKCNKNHYINMETNGFFLSNYLYAKSLVDGGLNSILLSFHSHREDIFEKITGIRKSFSVLEKTIQVLKKLDLEVEISFVLCKYNYKDLPDTIEYLKNNINFKGVLFANIFETINYNSKKDFHVSLGELEPYLLEGYKLLKKYGKEINSCGIPMCYLRGFEDTYYLGQYDINRYYKKDSSCCNCLVNEYCRGIIGEFSDIYGTGFVKPYLNYSPLLIEKLDKLKKEYLSSKNLKINNSYNY